MRNKMIIIVAILAFLCSSCAPATQIGNDNAMRQVPCLKLWSEEGVLMQLFIIGRQR